MYKHLPNVPEKRCAGDSEDCQKWGSLASGLKVFLLQCLDRPFDLSAWPGTKKLGYLWQLRVCC